MSGLTMKAERPKLVKNAARCLLCLQVIESKHRHDWVQCKCGNLFVDGGLDYTRRGWRGSPESWEDDGKGPYLGTKPLSASPRVGEEVEEKR